MHILTQTFPDIMKEALPLSRHSSFKIGGPADLAAFPRTEKELCAILSLAKEQGIRTMIVGNGSNLLFDDAGFRGLIVFTTSMKEVKWEEPAVTADAGASLTALAWEAAKRGLSGLEFAYGIPGTIGGAVYMNAGAYGGEIAKTLSESTYFDGETIRTRSAEEHLFSYRKSIYQTTREVITSARFVLQKGDAGAIQRQCEEHFFARKEKQPLEFPSAGSTFKRPEGHFAGALVEKSGLKNHAIGGTAVSEKHAGFVINRGGATAEDVRRLIAHIQNEVQNRFGVHLEPEIIFVPAEG